MQGQLTRPTNPEFIAYPGTPDELWWDTTTQQWVKAAVPPMPNLDKVVAAFSAIRDARNVARQAWEKKDSELEDDQRKLKVLMLELLNATGAKSIATDHGTVYRTEKVKPSAADWGAIHNWIMEDPDRFELLERRLKSTFVKSYMEAHDGQIPPGINVHREYEVSVRRANTSTTSPNEGDA